MTAEMEKLGHKYRLALKLSKDPRFEKLKCDHKGTYADDCIVNRVKQVEIRKFKEREKNHFLESMFYCCHLRQRLKTQDQENTRSANHVYFIT